MVDQIKAGLCPTLCKHYRNKNNLVAHRVSGRNSDIKTHLVLNDIQQQYCKIIVVGIILVVLIDNCKNICEMNDCGNIKQRQNELIVASKSRSVQQ